MSSTGYPGLSVGMIRMFDPRQLQLQRYTPLWGRGVHPIAALVLDLLAAAAASAPAAPHLPLLLVPNGAAPAPAAGAAAAGARARTRTLPPRALRLMDRHYSRFERLPRRYLIQLILVLEPSKERWLDVMRLVPVLLLVLVVSAGLNVKPTCPLPSNVWDHVLALCLCRYINNLRPNCRLRALMFDQSGRIPHHSETIVLWNLIGPVRLDGPNCRGLYTRMTVRGENGFYQIYLIPCYSFPVSQVGLVHNWSVETCEVERDGPAGPVP